MDLSSIIGSPTNTTEPQNESKRNAIIASVAFVILLGVGIWYGGNYFSKNVLGIDMDPTIEPPGDIRAFDPIKTYTDVHAYAGEGTLLTKISATYVQNNGTLDLMAALTPTPFVTYDFVREVAAGPDAPPIGAGSSASGTQWQTISIRVGSPGQRSYVKRTTGSTSQEYFYKNRGMKKEEGSLMGSNYKTIIPEPTCSFKDLWDDARERGAPVQAVAVIEYDKVGYAFSIRDTDFRMTFGMDCTAQTFKGQKL